MREQSRSPTLAEVIRQAVKANQADIHVGLPGKIDSYTASEQKADVKLLLKRPLVAVDGTPIASESLPLLMDVPVVFPRGGGFFLSWPLAPGDLVHVMFIERSIDQWLDTTGNETEPTDPADYRMHNLSDAVAYPGLYPRKLSLSDANSDNAVLGEDGGTQIHIEPNSGTIHLGSQSAAEFVALAQKVLSELQSVQSDQQTLQGLLASHVHPGVTAGPAATGTSPAFAGYVPHTPASVAASKVKAD